ncbi:MAG TPA: cytochrome o ubiquinol oxidase subunit III [Candidatus Saccharimonadales bacterium]|nr:cytochrome o ubiquinol oxidase subunit III [Candidatus Saccharimonadales bacterium]
MIDTSAQELLLAEEQARADDKSIFGFWAYIMTDCVLFASLFAVYAVLHTNTFGGPGGKQIFNLPLVLTETMALLTSSFTTGLALLASRRRQKSQVLLLLIITFILGILFLSIELTEFRHLVHEGNSWRRSGFLSSFFALVGTHGIHITSGLIWLAVLISQIITSGFSRGVMRRLAMFSLFWHFLDIVWIFIFTIVYLLGVA